MLPIVSERQHNKTQGAIVNKKNNKKGWFHGWNVLGLTLLFQAISYGLVTYGFVLYVVPWQQEFGASIREIMMAIVVFQLSAGVQSAFVGRALDKYSAQSIVILGAVLLVVGFSLIANASTLGQIIILYATLIPAAIAMTGPVVAQSLIIRWFVARRGMAMGISAVGTSIGGLIFPVLIGLILASSGWRQSLLVLPSIGAVFIFLFAFAVLNKKPPQSQNQEVRPSGNNNVDAILATDNCQWTTQEIFANKSFWILVVAFIPLIATYSAVQFNFGLYMKTLGHEPEQTAALISITAFSMLLGKFAIGYFADFIDVRWLYGTTVLAMCAVLILLQNEPPLWLIRVCASFLGISIGGYIPLSGITIGALFGMASFGRVMGLFTMFITLGAFGSILAGWIYDQVSDFDIVFSVFFAIVSFPALSMIFLKMPPKERVVNA